jgi:hypothetical protein
LDAVFGDVNNPNAVFDLKTGGASLSANRIKQIKQIKQNLPEGSQNISINQMRPNKSSN